MGHVFHSISSLEFEFKDKNNNFWKMSSIFKISWNLQILRKSPILENSYFCLQIQIRICVSSKKILKLLNSQKSKQILQRYKSLYDFGFYLFSTTKCSTFIPPQSWLRTLNSGLNLIPPWCEWDAIALKEFVALPFHIVLYLI